MSARAALGWPLAVICVGSKGSGLGGLTLIHDEEDDGTTNIKTIEIAAEGGDIPASQDYNVANFTLDKLVIGRTGATGKITLKLLDDEDNQGDGAGNESLFVKTLQILPYGWIDL